MVVVAASWAIAAEGGALDRGGGGVGRVDLHDPAEAVGLVGVLLQVETLVDAVPATAAEGGGEGVAGQPGLRLGGGLGGVDEVLVEVLLGGQHGAPRGRAAGAVVQHALDDAAARVGGGLQVAGARGRAGEPHRGVDRDAAVVAARAGGDELPAAGVAAAPDLDDRTAVGGLGDLDLVGGGVVAVGVAAEHQLFVGVLVVHPQQPAVTAELEQRHEVAVVAELLGLRARPSAPRSRKRAHPGRPGRPSGPPRPTGSRSAP